MKKIKYRAWVKRSAYPKDNKEVMLPVTGLEWDYQKGEHLVYVIGADPTGCPDCDEWEIKTEDCVLMQFTGLKDCNGVDIYEGDIVKINDIYKDDDGAEFANNHISEVKWDNNYALFTVDITEDGEWYYSGNISFYEFDKTDIEVIGNKFENLELIEESD